MTEEYFVIEAVLKGGPYDGKIIELWNAKQGSQLSDNPGTDELPATIFAGPRGAAIPERVDADVVLESEILRHTGRPLHEYNRSLGDDGIKRGGALNFMAAVLQWTFTHSREIEGA